eukprot:gnl/Hemi2/8355_TR2883_c0_g1_i1.p1 gnl/Hemi2/8355_TR2883_c0_g1~~gnl/Hemi2/8355_TR2883_c0_g1_i1.p1  ORF type:complete len:871 (+),score=328.96 gnl/Hemi2/8355_TR2883_c0_g1_i1:207-2819(+)
MAGLPPSFTEQDFQQFEQILLSTQGTDNQARTDAEAQIEAAKGRPGVLVDLLLACIRHSRHESVQLLAPIILRNMVAKGDDNLWPHLDFVSQHKVKTELIALVENEERHSLRKTLCDSIGDLATGILETPPGWPELLPFLLQWARSDNVNHRINSFLILSQIQYVDAQVRPHYTEYHNVISMNFLADNSDLRKAVFKAVSCTIPFLDEKSELPHFQQFLTPIIETLNDMQNPRIQCLAAFAAINMVENLEQAQQIMPPYLDALMNGLFNLATLPVKYVVEQAIATIGWVGASCGPLFAPFYPRIIPFIKTVLERATDKSDVNLRCKALECWTNIGVTVGNEIFRADCDALAGFLKSLEGNEDEMLRPHILQAWTRICQCIGVDFVPFLPYVLPPLLHSANLAPDMKIISAEDLENLEGLDEGVEIIAIGETRIVIRTTVLEEKSTACRMVSVYLDILKEHFFPYLAETAGIMIPLLKFYADEETRTIATTIVPDLARVAVLALGSGQCQASDVKDLLHTIMDNLIVAIKKEPESEIRIHMVDCMREVIEVCGEGCLSVYEEMAPTLQALMHILSDSQTRIRKRAERRHNADHDHVEEKSIIKLNKKENELQTMICQCLGGIMKLHKTTFLPYFKEMLPVVMEILQPGHSDLDHKIGLFVICDAVEHLQDITQPFMPQFLEYALNYCADPDAEVRQAAVFLIGVSAQHGGQAFAPCAAAAVQRLHALTTDPHARVGDNESVTDNAVCALVKLALAHSNVPGVQLDQLLPFFLNYLPVHGDNIESKAIYGYLCTFIEEQNPLILGQDFCNIPKIISVFADCLGTDYVDAPLTARMLTIVKALQANAALAPVLLQTWGCLPPDQQEKLHKLLS